MTTMKMRQMAGKDLKFSSLAGQLLIAMPGIDDDRFDKAVIYISTHTPEAGAMGIVINYPAQKMSLYEILEQLSIPYDKMDNPPAILLGGPDQMTRGFILHSNDYHSDLSVSIDKDISLTASQDILKDLINGKGPRYTLIALGCATWTAGQLEEEIMSNIWLTAPASIDLLFKTPYAHMWEEALSSIGVNAPMLANDFGKA